MKCPYCGTENTPGTKICIACNAKLYEENEQQPSQSSSGWYGQPQSQSAQNQPTQPQPQANTYGQGWTIPTQNQPTQTQTAQNTPGWNQGRMAGAAGWNSAATPNTNANGAPYMFAAGAPNMFTAGAPMKKAEKTASSGARTTFVIGGIAAIISALLYFAYFTKNFTKNIPISVFIHNMGMLPHLVGYMLPVLARILMGVFALQCIKKWTPKKMILPVCLSILAIIIKLLFMRGAIRTIPGRVLITSYVLPLCALIILLISMVLQPQGQKIAALISCIFWGYDALPSIISFSRMLGANLSLESALLFNLSSSILWNAALFLICIGLVCGPQKDAQRV